MSVADILQEMARNAGRATLTRGAILGDVIAGAAHVPAEILDARDRQRQMDEQRARQRAQDARQAAGDARQAAADTRDEAQRQKTEQERQERGAIMTAGLDPENPTAWHFEPAVAKAMSLNRHDIARELIDAHDKAVRDARPKTPTELAMDAANPSSPTQAQSTTALDLTRPPRAEPAPKALQSENEWQVDGKSTPVIFDPASGARYLTQDDVAAKKPIDPSRMKKIAPASQSGGAGGGVAGGLDPDAVDYTATQYRILGPQGIPTRIGEADKTRILNAAAKQAKALRQSPAQAVQKQAAYKSDAASLTKITAMAAAAEAFETKAIAQADLVKSLSAKVGRTEWPLVNGVLLSGKAALGDTDTHLFSNALLTFTTEYAKLMEGSTGSAAGSSEGARREAAKLISTALKNGTIDKTIDQMQWEMRQTREGYRATTDHITERMGGAPAAAPAAPPKRIVYDMNGNPVK